MQIFTDLPALIKVSLTFGLILTASRVKVQLSLALFIGALVLGLLMGLPFLEIPVLIVKSLVDPMVISLLLIVTAILILSRLMSDSGQLDRIVSNFSDITHNVRTVAAVMPALIGLLPMPGGALFSAPMVNAAANQIDLNPNMKTAINYWFRHIWECWWPLYPGVILAVSLLGVETWRFMAVQFPLTFVAVGSGFFFLLRSVPSQTQNPVKNDSGPARRRWAAFLKEIQPILLVVLAIPLVTLFEIASGIDLPRMSSVFTGLCLCLIWVIIQNRMPMEKIRRNVLDKSLLPMLFLVLGIMGFKGILIESQAVDQIHAELTQYGIPPLLVILLMPFLSGFITGLAIGFVGAAFPLIVPLLAPYQGLEFMAYAFLAYSAGFVGMMLSPVHLCLLVTRDYYQANLVKSYGLLMKPVAGFVTGTLVLFGLFLLLD
jgi:integral membrane protein (TIGR00529 family)